MYRKPTIKKNHMSLSSFNFLVSMVTYFQPKCNKCSKMRSKCKYSPTLRARESIFSEMRQFIKLKEIPNNGSISASKLHPMASKPYKC